MRHDASATAIAAAFFPRIAGRYAEIASSLRALQLALASHPELLMFFEHPFIVLAKKIEVFKSLFEFPDGGDFDRLATVLLKRRDIHLLPFIIRELQQLQWSSSQTQEVRITTAFDLTDEQKGALAAVLQRSLRKNIEAAFDVEQGLLAGAVIRMGNTVIDNSIHKQLQEYIHKFRYRMS